jgi:hypothetical protein
MPFTGAIESCVTVALIRGEVQHGFRSPDHDQLAVAWLARGREGALDEPEER